MLYLCMGPRASSEQSINGAPSMRSYLVFWFALIIQQIFIYLLTYVRATSYSSIDVIS